MVKDQMPVIKISDEKIIKVLNKPFTKRILDCFDDKPKTASQIANSISFPKEKIYYHIKKLISAEILFITSTDIVKGIEQKLFLPTGKDFKIIATEKTPHSKTDSLTITKDVYGSDNSNTNADTNSKKEHTQRKLDEKRKKNERRNRSRRKSKDRRNKKNIQFQGKEKRSQSNRRKPNDQRNLSSRRQQMDGQHKGSGHKKLKLNQNSLISKKVTSIPFKNILLKLNGVKKAMTFVQSGNSVTFLLCNLNNDGFEIERINNYVLPFQLKDHKITTLTELIINISNQFNTKEKSKKTYLAIHSDDYQLQMTCLTSKGKSNKLFEKNLIQILKRSYNLKDEHSIYDFIPQKGLEKNAIVCLSNKRDQIKKDYNELIDSGLQPRYNTSIPQILNNIHSYYNLHHKDEYSLLIYIDKEKSHLVFSRHGQIFESMEINKGLNYFTDALIALSVKNQNADEAKESALHFLSHYGIGAETSDLVIQDGIPFKKALKILDHQVASFIHEIKDCIYYFEKTLLHDGFSEQVIKNIFLCGVGSHIKNINIYISESLRMDVRNLSDYNTAFMSDPNKNKEPLFKKIRVNGLFKKKDGKETQLEKIKEKIFDHERAIETAQSPESAKYRLTRIEMEKESKFKLIETANQKLLSASKEFKQIKNDYIAGQDGLKSDLSSVTTLLEEETAQLLEKYKENEEIVDTISQLEYESDLSKNKGNNDKLDSKGQYQSRVKNASRSRTKLGDEKEGLDQDIDEIESTIIRLEESLQLINQNIENGQDEVNVFEYLKDSIQSTASAFKVSFLDHLKSVENLAKEDLNNLQRSSYLLIQNTKRIDEIRQSFKAIASGELGGDSQNIIDGKDGIEVRKKLLKILKLVLDAPENLIQLKNLTGSIIKINESQKEMSLKYNEIKDQSRYAKRAIKDNQKSLNSINKEIEVHEKEVVRKVNDRQEEVDLLKYVRDTVDMIYDLQHHSTLINELRPQKKLHNDDLKDITSRMKRLSTLIDSNENSDEVLEIEQAELEKAFEQDKKYLNDRMDLLGNDEETTKKELDDNIAKVDGIVEEISNASTYIKQLEKQVITKKQEIEIFNKDKTPIAKEFNIDRKKIIDEFDANIKKVNEEEDRKISEAKRSKSVTIEAFFKKELLELEKKDRVFEKSLIKAKRDRDRAKADKQKAHSSLTLVKNKNNPKIANLKKQIHGLQKDLNQGRRFQERLDNLEAQKREWDDQLDHESKNINDQIDLLNKTISRKSSDSYMVFLKDGLDRFKSTGDAEEIARSMARESIALDKDEISKLSKDLEIFMGKYEQFMRRYRKGHRTVMMKLKPYGGRKKTILGKINKAKDRVQKLESMTQVMIDKVDAKNELLIEYQNVFNDLSINVQRDRNQIKNEIKNIPNKKKNASIDIDKRLKERLDNVAIKRSEIREGMEKRIKILEASFSSRELIIKITEAEDRMLFFFSEIESTKEKIDVLLGEEKKLKRSGNILENRLEKIFKMHDSEQRRISRKEDQFKEQKIILAKKIDSNRSEFSILQDQLLALDEQKDDVTKKLGEVDKSYRASNDVVKELKKSIKVPYDSDKNKTRPNRKEQLKYLSQMDKDMSINIERSERMIKDLNILVDSLNNEKSEFLSTINLLQNDLEYYEKDQSRIDILIQNNKEHLSKLSIDHRKSLNAISNIKELYPASKIMLNNRITNLYTILELKVKDRDSLDGEIDEIKEELKNKRVEVALLDQELAKINEEMKIALESSFYDVEAKNDEWKWEIADRKMNSYMDLAQLKTQSKVLFNSITETEERIAKLKSQQSSINKVISEKEKTSHKKIKQMEEICTRLELQITKEKNEIDGLEEEVRHLTGLAFNYGDRVDVLEQELKDYREKQAEYEIELNDLDRSLESIQDRSDKIMRKQRSLKGNSIQIDYMANLGLLMDPEQKLNILPKVHKKEYKYFRVNQILQNAVLVLITVFAIGSFIQRTKIEPLESMLPVKQSELSLLKMRQEMRDVVSDKNLVANTFSQLVKDDKTISAEMISMLKYLSQTIPMDFKVTNLTLDKIQPQNNSKDTDSNQSKISISINGFFEQSQGKASTYAAKLIKTLSDTKKFESVEIEKEKEISSKRTNYLMRILR